MKIAYLLTDYVNSGGIERVISIKTAYLVSKGYEVYIITYLKTEGKPFFDFDPGIKILSLDIPSEKKEYKKLFLTRLNQILLDIKVDILISTGLRIMNSITTLKDGSKKVLEMHFSMYRRKFAWAKWEENVLGRLFLKMYFHKRYKEIRDFDRIILLTNEDRKSWSLQPFNNLVVIPNPLSFLPVKRIPINSKKIIAIGRFVYAKGFDILIDIWRIVEKDYPDWKLVIYGEDRYNSKIEKKLKKGNLKERIDIYPPVPHIREELLNSEIFVMSSRYEALPMGLLESMTCSLPAVAFRCKCGPGDLIQDSQSGYLIEPGNKKEFAERLSELIKNPELRFQMGEKAYERSKNYETEKVMQLWISLFNELTTENQ